MKTRILPVIIISGLLLCAKGIIACDPPPPIPIAILSGSPTETFVGNIINLDGRESQTLCGIHLCRFEWDFHYDGSFDIERDTGDWSKITSYSYSEPGTYTIALRVMNYPCGYYSVITSQSQFTVTVRDVIYVKWDATGSNNGLSWENAFNRLEDALNVASDGVQIWVAQGTYRPTAENASFVLKSNITIYGGFTGNETIVAEKDWVNNKTILSGDVANNDDQPGDPYADNSYNVVKGANGAVLDGFVIMSGIANYLVLHEKGGGMFNDGVSPIVRNCEFLGNWAIYGGAIYNNSSAVQISNCIFSGNGAGRAGAIYNNASNASIVGCTFSQNGVTDCGGIYNSNSNPAIISCIVYGNTEGSVINVSASQPYISFSDVEGCGGSSSWNSVFGTNGGGNKDAPPLFEDADGDDDIVGTIDDDFHLQTGSPCIGTGVGGENMGFNWPKDATTLNNVNVLNPVDLVVSSSGDVYVLNASATSPSQVLIYDASLTPQGSPIDVDATNPKGIALDSAGRVYIADTGGNRILRYKNDSGWILDVEFDGDGIVGEYGIGDSQFDQPWGIAVDWSGLVYVTDNGNDCVKVFNSTGGFERKWGQSGSGDGQLDGPSGLCLLGTSNVFVAEAENDRIQNLSPSGSFFGKIGSQGSGAGKFNSPRDVCYDLKYSQLIVTDTANNRLQIFQLNSDMGEATFVMEIDDQDLTGSMGVTCASTDTQQIIYVSDTGNNRIVRLEIKKDSPARTPLHVMESMKGALYGGDKNRAVGYFTDMSKDRYAQIFDIIESHLQEYVVGMGDLILQSQDEERAVYEMDHQDGSITYCFPVVFIKDDTGNWKIYNF